MFVFLVTAHVHWFKLGLWCYLKTQPRTQLYRQRTEMWDWQLCISVTPLACIKHFFFMTICTHCSAFSYSKEIWLIPPPGCHADLLVTLGLPADPKHRCRIGAHSSLCLNSQDICFRLLILKYWINAGSIRARQQAIFRRRSTMVPSRLIPWQVSVYIES